MPRRVMVLSLAVAVLCGRSAIAQTPLAEDHAPSGIILGMTLGVPGFERHAQPDFLVLGLNVLNVKPSRVGIDFALGTMPKAFSNQALVLGGRLDGTVPIAVTPDLWLLPVAGGSMIGGAAAGGGTALPGVNAGIGTILWSGHHGFRTSMTWHRFGDTRGAIWLAEFGFVGGK